MKAYLVYTNKLYQGTVLLFLILATLLQGLLMRVMIAQVSWAPFFIMPFLVACLFILGEVWMDHYMFGPCCKKDVYALELLRTSGRGLAVYEQVLKTDMLRHLVWAELQFMGMSLLAGGSVRAVSYCLFLASSVCFGILVGIMIVRRVEYQLGVTLTIYVAVAVSALLNGFVGSAFADKRITAFDEYRFGLIPGLICLALDLGMMYLIVRTTMNHRKESYYDSKE